MKADSGLNRWAVLVVGILALGVVISLASPRPVAAQSSLCPSMTDSVVRLFKAYFNREPSQAEFNDRVLQYRSGQGSLEDISRELAESPEFAAFGLDTNERFLDWFYAGEIGARTDPASRQTWLDTLNGGYGRGSMMVSFTESQDWISFTSTEIPLAGFSRWYPRGTHWYCDIGSISSEPVLPLMGQLHADFLFDNRSTESDSVGLWTATEGQGRNLTMNQGTMSPFFVDYNWRGSFSGDGNYGNSIEVLAGPQTQWIVVFYPDDIGPDRAGWQLG